MSYVYKFIEDLNIKSEYVVAAISGGPDSMYLLDILQKLKYLKVTLNLDHH